MKLFIKSHSFLVYLFRALIISILGLSASSLVFAEESYEELDSYESINRAIFKFNDQADKYILKPVAQAYQFVTPSFVDQGITKVFNNLDDVEPFANSLFQAKFHNPIVSLNRVI